jgi:putative ABC transport system permease protein
MLNSFVRLVRVDPGFQSDHLLTMSFNLGFTQNRDVGILPFGPRMDARFTPRTALVQQQLLERIETLPEVASVGLVSFPDRVQPPVSILGRPGAARDEPFQVGYREISADYFRTLGVRLLKGRVFTARDASGAPGVAIINETMARQLFAGEDPLGARLQADLGGEIVPEDFIDDRPRTIVGVVGDVRRSLRAETDPVMYVPDGQHLDVYGGGSWLMRNDKRLVIRTAADPLSLVGVVRTAIADVDPDLVPFNIMTMDAWLADGAAQEEFWTLVLGLFAGLAVTLAVIGLYGVISYAVAERTHELGVRTALGATRNDVFTLIVRRGLVLALLGVAIGIPAAVALTRLIASQLFGVTPTDPATFAAASVVFVGIAVLACSIPARRATKVDPLVALRAE